MSETKKMTLDEQLAKAEAKVAALRAKKALISRQERNGQLVACGIVIENKFADFSDTFVAELEKAIEAQTEERIKDRARNFLVRLRKTRP